MKFIKLLPILFILLNSLHASSRSTIEIHNAEKSGYPAGRFLFSGDLTTKLYFSEVTGKRPLVVLLHGSEGGFDFMEGEVTRGLLERGFHVLGICYFAAGEHYLGPKKLNKIRLESFSEELENYLKVHSDSIDSGIIGLYGVSKGGELALLLGSLYPQFKFVVGVVPSSIVFQASSPTPFHSSSWVYKSKEVPFVAYPLMSMNSIKCALTLFAARRNWFGYNNTMVQCNEMHMESIQNVESLEGYAIKVENINGPILFVSGSKDQYWPSTHLSDLAQSRLKQKNFSHPYSHLSFEGDHYSYDRSMSVILDITRSMVEYVKSGNKRVYEAKTNRIVKEAFQRKHETHEKNFKTEL